MTSSGSEQVWLCLVGCPPPCAGTPNLTFQWPNLSGISSHGEKWRSSQKSGFGIHGRSRRTFRASLQLKRPGTDSTTKFCGWEMGLLLWSSPWLTTRTWSTSPAGACRLSSQVIKRRLYSWIWYNKETLGYNAISPNQLKREERRQSMSSVFDIIPIFRTHKHNFSQRYVHAAGTNLFDQLMLLWFVPQVSLRVPCALSLPGWGRRRRWRWAYLPLAKRLARFLADGVHAQSSTRQGLNKTKFGEKVIAVWPLESNLFLIEWAQLFQNPIY